MVLETRQTVSQRSMREYARKSIIEGYSRTKLSKNNINNIPNRWDLNDNILFLIMELDCMKIIG